MTRPGARLGLAARARTVRRGSPPRWPRWRPRWVSFGLLCRDFRAASRARVRWPRSKSGGSSAGSRQSVAHPWLRRIFGLPRLGVEWMPEPLWPSGRLVLWRSSLAICRALPLHYASCGDRLGPASKNLGKFSGATLCTHRCAAPSVLHSRPHRLSASVLVHHGGQPQRHSPTGQEH